MLAEEKRLENKIQHTEHAGDDGAGGFEVLPVFVEGDITIKRGQLKRAVVDSHDLSGIEDQADIVKGRGDVAAGRDVALPVLVFEGGFEREPCEEWPCCWDQHAQFGG